MDSETQTFDVAIVGGGPVGLFLACCLQKTGVDCRVFEQRDEPITHSRSIGIQPISLELFRKIGLADRFVEAGIKVEEGRAFCHEKPIGTLSFRECPPPYPFILTLPQYKTEQLLRQRLQQINANILQPGATVTSVEHRKDGVQLEIDYQETTQKIDARFVIGCDGKDSFVREAMGVSFHGKRYDDTYIMGDFTDNTDLGSAAGIFLCRQGVIESFPLSETMRRWVIKTDTYLPNVTRRNIEKRLKERIGHNLGGTENVMLSSFGVEKKFAETMAKGRIFLAGDAAHAISPIGGQGMNLGWLDGWDLSQCLLRALANEQADESVFKAYSRRRLRVARKAARRAEFNMIMGRASALLPLKKWGLQAVLQTPLAGVLARMFTMRGL